MVCCQYYKQNPRWIQVCRYYRPTVGSPTGRISQQTAVSGVPLKFFPLWLRLELIVFAALSRVFTEAPEVKTSPRVLIFFFIVTLMHVHASAGLSRLLRYAQNACKSSMEILTWLQVRAMLHVIPVSSVFSPLYFLFLFIRIPSRKLSNQFRILEAFYAT